MKQHFKNCLSLGHQYEIYASELLEKSHGKKAVKFNRNYKYDFCDEDGTKYEVKYDKRCNETGNIFVEFSVNSKPSGVFRTEATKHIFMTDKETAYMIDTEKLKEMIRDEKYKRVFQYIVCDKVIGGYIFDKDVIFDSSIKI